jgi:pimeloyl-ACP methyl ester carboxylesterase
MMQKTFQYQNAAISYDIYGTGKPVVLLHGFAEDSTIWNNQVGYLESHCKLIVPDLPGSGQSELLQDANEIEDYADGIYALLTHEEVNSCITLGHSMGGYITLAFAGKYAAKLTGFGLINSTAFADSEEKKLTRKKGIAMMEEYGVLPFIKNTTPNLFSQQFKKEHPEVVAALTEQGKDFSTAALVQYYTAMMNRPDSTEVLKTSEVPVLFIIGSEDVAAPLNDLLEQVHLPKVSHIHIIEGVGHMSMLEAPDELNKHLLQFIEALNLDKV